MSAFICNDEHFNAIVNFFAATGEKLYIYTNFPGQSCFDPFRLDDCTHLGQILLDANIKSVNYRYHDNTEPHVFQYRFKAPVLTPVQFLKALDCLEYQSCEDPGFFKDSKAWAIIQGLRKKAIQKLPGYDDSEWEIIPQNKKTPVLPETGV